MRVINKYLIILAVVVFLNGCSEKKTSSQPPNQAAGREASLPPPGQPRVGTTPPMPRPVAIADPNYKVDVIASNLEIPWDMAFVSENRIYVTERPGRVRLIRDGKLESKPYATINVVRGGEGGLMGIALHPDYPNPRWVYLMYTASNGNRISRFTDTGSGLTDEQPVATGIASSPVHDGGIIRFGPDGMLYAGTGDAREPERSQNRSSLNGKILRMTPEGKTPEGNPFPNSLVYAYGLRNPQGLAWNPDNGDLWVVDHGPSGEFGLEAKDSVFIIREGGNHGWPRVLGVTNVRDVVDPVLFYPDYAVAPAQAMFYNSNLMPDLKGNFFFTTLRGEMLVRVILSDAKTIRKIENWWSNGRQSGRYGRLRAVRQGPDGAIYVSTSNRDGRGGLNSGDDKILRISPK